MPERTASTNPAVHRDLIVMDPPQEGRDVADLQRAIAARLDARGIKIPTPTHGKFTHATWLAAIEAGYALGLQSATYLKTDQHRGVSTQGAQTIIRDPDARTAVQRSRASARAEQVKRGPRYYDDLAHKAGISGGHGAQAAVDFLVKHVGTHETPAGSNWGGVVEGWIKLAGYDSPEPWCGCATNAALIAAGISNGRAWGIGYCPNVISHAKAGRDGWSWHTTGQLGDIIVFAGPDGEAEHQGLSRGHGTLQSCPTVEGNTSSSAGGSQDNGGTVAEHERVSSSAFRILGYARPPY